MGLLLAGAFVGWWIGLLVRIGHDTYTITKIEAETPKMTNEQSKQHTEKMKEWCRENTSICINYKQFYESLKSFKQYGSLKLSINNADNLLELSNSNYNASIVIRGF